MTLTTITDGSVRAEIASFGVRNAGPYVDSNGDVYVLGVLQSNTQTLAVIKTTNGGSSWALQDSGGAPTTSTTINNMMATQNGDTLHIIVHENGSGGMTPTYPVRYYTFHFGGNGTTPDEWVISETVGTFGVPEGQDNAGVLALRSDGDVITTYPAPNTQMGTNYSYQYIARRESGSWTTGQTHVTQTTEFQSEAVGVIGSNDRTHIFIITYNVDVPYHRIYALTLSPTNGVAVESTHAYSATSGLTTSGRSFGRAVSWDDGGTQRVWIHYVVSGTLVGRRMLEDGSDNIDTAGTDRTLITSQSLPGAMRQDPDGGDFYFLVGETADTNDVTYRQSSDGDSWDAAVDLDAAHGYTGTFFLVGVEWVSNGTVGILAVQTLDVPDTFAYGEYSLGGVSGQTINVGTVAELDALVSAGVLKPVVVAAGTVDETDSLISAALLQPQSVDVGTFAEADSLIAADPYKTAQVGVLAEAESLVTADPLKTVQIGQILEADLLNTISPAVAQSVNVDQINESDLLIAVQALKVAGVGTLVEDETLITVEALKTIIQDVGQITEADTPIDIQALKPITELVGTTAESDTLVTVEALKTIVQDVGLIAGTDTLLSIEPEKFADVGTLSETETLRSIFPLTGIPVTALSELETLVDALAVKPIIVPVTALDTIESLIDIFPEKIAAVGLIAETETLNAITPYKTASVGQVTELESLNPITALKEIDLGTLAETNSLLDAQPLKIAPVGPLSETETLLAISSVKVAVVGVITESDLLIPVALIQPVVVAVTPLATIDTLLTLTQNPNAVLYATGDGTIQSVVNEANNTTDLWQSIDDDPDSPNDSDYINNAAALSGGDASTHVAVTDLPVSFEAAASARILVRVRGATWSGGTARLYGRIYRADETTPLSDEVELVAISGDSSFTNFRANFTGVVAGSKTDWDGARVRFRWSNT